MDKIKKWMNNFFRNDHDEIIIGQKPNGLIIGWAASSLVSMLLGHTHTLVNGFNWLGSAFLFAWAYSEITQGDTYFRRLLGVIVGIIIITPHFLRV
jgi:hypothetical protein